MEKKLVTKYRIVRVLQTVDLDASSDSTFTLTLADPSDHNYGPDYRAEDEFNTHEEAMTHAMNSEKWVQTVFTILPLYYISTSNY